MARADFARGERARLPQINLLVAPQPGALHEGVYGGINQIDLLVLRWAPASFIGTEVVQLCQQLANVELLEVELDTEIVAACQHHFHVQIAGQASGLHVNPQLSLENLHGSKDHTISRAWQLQAVLAMPELRHVLGNGGCPCWWLKRTTQLCFYFGWTTFGYPVPLRTAAASVACPPRVTTRQFFLDR